MVARARRLRFGLVGTGHWAQTVHAVALQAHPAVEFGGVWGRDPAKARALAEQYGAHAFEDPAEMFAAVDATAFTVPADVQARLAVQAAAAGCRLLLEKPLAFSAAAADEVVRAVQAANVATIVFFTLQMAPWSAHWLQQILRRGGWSGARAVWLASVLTPGNPFGASAWRRDRGALWDVGPHCLSMILPVLGSVCEVTGVRGRADTVELALGHENGTTTSMLLSLAAPSAAATIELAFHGEGGWSRMPTGDLMPLLGLQRAITHLVTADGAQPHPCDVALGREVVEVLTAAQAALHALPAR